MPISYTPGSKLVDSKLVDLKPEESKLVEPLPSSPIIPSTKTVSQLADATKKSKKSSELATLIAQIKKDKGEKLILLAREVPDVRRIATGLFEFDFATNGGFPRGRYSMIFGPESSTKSNLALLAAAEAQRGPEECNKVVWIDLEHQFDPTWAVLFGVNIDELIVVKPGYGEEAVDVFDALVRADDVALIVVDSIAVLIPSKEVEQSVEIADVAMASTLVKRMCNKAVVGLSLESRRNHEPAVILINQIRYKVGKAAMFGNPETTPGGKTKDFLSSLTIRVQGKPKIIKEFNPDMPAFKEVEARIVKSKVGIIRSDFKFDMALMPVGDLGVGESASWDLVKNELQAAGLLVSPGAGKGYILDGKNWKTLTMIEDTYYAEKAYAMHLQQMVIQRYSGKKFILDNTEKIANEPIPKETS
jgi:recombination protein RecA